MRIASVPRLAVAAGLALVAGSCGQLPGLQSPLMRMVHPMAAPVIHDNAGGERWMDIRVMSFNVAGLPQPLRRTRADALRQIASGLANLRLRGDAPDVLLLQEAFTADGEAIGPVAGYAHAAHGPRAGDAASIDAQPMPASFIEGQRPLKGEGLFKVVGSGLHIFSDFPMLASRKTAFRADACAGTDCFARKGAVMAELAIPGLPQPLSIATTHLNSFKDAGQPFAYSLIAFRRQTQVLARFVAGTGDRPLILAGDFNASETADRMAALQAALPLANMLDACRVGCSKPADLRGGPAEARSLDQHYARNGAQVQITPIQARWRFDLPVDGAMLSDHRALEVTYRLSWKAALAPRSQ